MNRVLVFTHNNNKNNYKHIYLITRLGSYDTNLADQAAQYRY